MTENAVLISAYYEAMNGLGLNRGVFRVSGEYSTLMLFWCPDHEYGSDEMKFSLQRINEGGRARVIPAGSGLEWKPVLRCLWA